jgi:Cytosol aminopeptidase family, catalytic domain
MSLYLPFKVLFCLISSTITCSDRTLASISVCLPYLVQISCICVDITAYSSLHSSSLPLTLAHYSSLFPPLSYSLSLLRTSPLSHSRHLSLYLTISHFSSLFTGINLKSAGSMKTMKHDMGGSAAALGTFLALTQTGPLMHAPVLALS